MLLIGGVLALLCAVQGAPNINSSLDFHWDLFKQTYGRNYQSSEEELTRRLIWEDNRAFIDAHNSEYNEGKHSHYLGENEFADLEHKEFVTMMNGYRAWKSPVPETMIPLTNEEAPSSVDWRKSGYVTGIKNQGGCGSCWAFSTTGSLEGQHARHNGQLVSLSEQNIVDCDKGSNGCRGGSMKQAMSFISQEGGIDTEQSYPYKGRQGTCRYNSRNKGATDTGYHSVPSSESSLAQAVASYGPVSVAIDASHRSFQLYRGGVYYESACSSSRLDHGVLAVGYGMDGSSAIWIVKNSWGTSWGQSGYVHMARGRNNMCGIATDASVPKV